MRDAASVSRVTGVPAVNPYRTAVAKANAARRYSLIVLLAVGWAASAGPTGAIGQVEFRSVVRTVAVHATVRDSAGRLVPDLPKDAFRVLDNGRPVSITVFSNDPQPIVAVAMLDMSLSNATAYARVRAAMLQFVAALRPDDRIRIGTFNDEVALSPHMTSHKPTLMRILWEELWPSGSTHLWQALDSAIVSLADEKGRRVVLALTDGLGAPPKGIVDAVWRRAIENPDLMVYAVSLLGERGEPRLRGAVVHLTELTGGGCYGVPAEADLAETFAGIATELRHQYVLGFTPPVLDGRDHRLDVRVERPGLVARARSSYTAVDR